MTVQLSYLTDFLTIAEKNQKKLTFDENLRENIEQLIGKLPILKNLNEINRYLQIKLKLAECGDEPSKDSIRWRYLRLLIYILLEAIDSRTDIMSVRNIQNLKKAFDFIGRLGIAMNLSNGFKCPVRSGASTAFEPEPERLTDLERLHRLYVCTKAFYLFIVEFVEHFRPLLLCGHVHELISGLFELRFRYKQDLVNEFQAMFEWLLRNLHQPTLVKELLAMLSNRTIDRDLLAFITRTLNRIIICTKTGVESVIRVVYDSLASLSNFSSSGNSGTDTGWSQIDFLARLLSRCQNQQSICHKLFALILRNERAIFLDRNFVIRIVAAVMKYLRTATDSSLNFQIYFDQFKSLVQNIFQNDETLAIALQLTYYLFVSDFKTVPRLEIDLIREFYRLFFLLYYRLCNGRDPNEYRSRFTNDLNEILMRIADASNEKPLDFDDVFIPKTNRNDYNFQCSIENGQLKLKPADEGEMTTTKHDLDPIAEEDGLIGFVIEHLFAKNDKQLRNLFDYLLRKSLGSEQDEKVREETGDGGQAYCRKMIYLQHLIGLLTNRSIVEKHLKSENPKSLIAFVREFLRQNIERKVHLSTGTDMDSDRYQQLFVLLVFLKTIFEQIDSFDGYRSLVDLLAVLMTESVAGSELQRLAAELCDILKPRRAKIEKTKKVPSSSSSSSTEAHYREMVRDLLEGEDFVRGHALIELTKMLEARDEVVLANEQYLMHLFIESLESDESYVFLSAINGLVALSDRYPSVVIETLTDRYVNWQRRAVAEADLRIKLGESLVRISRRLNEMLIKYRAQLLHAFLCAARDPDPALRTSALANLAEFCRVLNFRLTATLPEIFMCIRAILCDDEHIEPRRAACFVLLELLRGLEATDSSAICVLKDHLLDIYRLLCRICNTPVSNDTVLVRHAAAALELLDNAAKQFLQLSHI